MRVWCSLRSEQETKSPNLEFTDSVSHHKDAGNKRSYSLATSPATKHFIFQLRITYCVRYSTYHYLLSRFVYFYVCVYVCMHPPMENLCAQVSQFLQTPEEAITPLKLGAT